MDKKRDLKDIPEYLTPEVAERVAQHFKDGVFEFDLNTEAILLLREIPFIMSFPTLRRTAPKASSASCGALWQEIWRKRNESYCKIRELAL